ncbi:MAG: hypothetical protein ACJAS1_006882 [Oleiphilaceae bacterium]|jgi:hypothetical protein
MTGQINIKIFTWAIGVTQPSTPEEALDYITRILSKNDDMYTDLDISLTIDSALKEGFIYCVSKKNNLYSLTNLGDINLGNKLRVLKDKNRLYLLKSMRNASFKNEGVPVRNRSGGSPLISARLDTEVSPRPEVSLGSGPHPQSQRNFWPRVYQQLKIGSKSGAPSLSINLNYYSSNRLPQIQSEAEAIFALAELIGVSAFLLRDFYSSTERYYRSFEIPKKSGKEARVINAPRTFIKTTQHWLLDYFLYRLRQHETCFSFRAKLSIKDNAAVHLNKHFVLSLDIKNFYGEISRNKVKACFEENNINIFLAEIFSKIVTLNESLPQGAPTSPIISNSLLYEFDVKMSEYSKMKEVSYSRYADDLTFGSDEYNVLEIIVQLVAAELGKIELKLNNSKTRIVSSNNCQIVTGVAINNGELRPSRKYRKKIRALFYKAELDSNTDLLPKLCGHLNYLESFGNGDTSHNLTNYRQTINKLKLKKK